METWVEGGVHGEAFLLDRHVQLLGGEKPRLGQEEVGPCGHLYDQHNGPWNVC